MKLFILERLTVMGQACVITVVASSEAEARLLASLAAQRNNDKDAQNWLNSARSLCEEVGMENPSVLSVTIRRA